MSEEFEPCPHCGAKCNVGFNGVQSWARCSTGKCAGIYSHDVSQSGVNSLKQRWNTRHEPELDALRIELAKSNDENERLKSCLSQSMCAILHDERDRGVAVSRTIGLLWENWQEALGEAKLTIPKPPEQDK